MANGLIGKIPGISKLGKSMPSGASKGAQAGLAKAQVTEGGQTSEGFSLWSPRKGVNGTTNPRGVGKWGQGA